VDSHGPGHSPEKRKADSEIPAFYPILTFRVFRSSIRHKGQVPGGSGEPLVVLGGQQASACCAVSCPETEAWGKQNDQATIRL
jgi:hypothetical protein